MKKMESHSTTPVWEDATPASKAIMFRVVVTIPIVFKQKVLLIRN